MGLGHRQPWASITRSFKSTSNWVQPCPALVCPGWSRGSGAGAAVPSLAGTGYSAAKPAARRRRAAATRERNRAVNLQVMKRKCWKRLGNNRAPHQLVRLGQGPPETGRSLYLFIYSSVYPSIHPSIYWRPCPQELTPVSCLVADGEEHTLRSTKQAQIESFRLRVWGWREMGITGH